MTWRRIEFVPIPYLLFFAEGTSPKHPPVGVIGNMADFYLLHDKKNCSSVVPVCHAILS